MLCFDDLFECLSEVFDVEVVYFVMVIVRFIEECVKEDVVFRVWYYGLLVFEVVNVSDLYFVILLLEDVTSLIEGVSEVKALVEMFRCLCDEVG